MLRKAFWMIVLLSAMAMLQATPVAAAGPAVNLELLMKPTATDGERVAIEAFLSDSAGAPLAGELVTFFLDTEFLNIAGRIQMGAAITDEAGRARVLHAFTQEGEATVTARLEGNDDLGEVETSQVVSLASVGQLYQEARPFRMPGANIAIVVAVLTTTWGILAAVVLLLCLVGRAGAMEERAIDARRLRTEEGGVLA